jgi:hypothetical protein
MKTHACDACGGSEVMLLPCDPNCACGGEAYFDCPVCLGAGSFPDQMPVADAVADAETLRVLLPHRLMLTDLPYLHVRCSADIPAWEDAENTACEWSRSAARAAFRAVPGLRG